MKQLQTKVQAQAMPRDLRSMIRYEIQRENSEIQRVLAQGVKKDLDSYNMRRADEIAGIRSEITGLRTSFNADKRKIYQRIDNESKTTGKVKSGAAPDRDTLQKKIAKLEKELQQASGPRPGAIIPRAPRGTVPGSSS
jgi:phage terminase small subunit